MKSEILLVFAALVALGFVLSIRICRESERIALNRPQRFVKLIGPGLFLRFPMKFGPYEYTRVRIGDQGCYIGNGWGRLNGKDMPVRPVAHLDIDETFKVEGFANREIHVAAG